MKIEKIGSHLDHLIRQTRMHHNQLSSMADVKASMLLTVASVVVTLCVPQLAKPELKIAACILMFFSLISVVLAAYAVMPKIPFFKPRQVNKPDVHASNFNILFFGDFCRLSFDEFEDRMEEVMNDPNISYEVQLREVYNIGVFLAKNKFRFIQLAYISFIIGLFSAAVAMFITQVL